jgi:hypothetical protein
MQIMFLKMKNQQSREKQNYRPAILLIKLKAFSQRKLEAEIFISFIL